MKGFAQVIADIQRRLTSRIDVRELASCRTLSLSAGSPHRLPGGFRIRRRAAKSVAGQRRKDSLSPLRRAGFPAPTLEISTHVIVPDVETAAGRRAGSGPLAVATVTGGNPRAAAPGLGARLQCSIDKYTEQTDLLNMAAAWFRSCRSHGLTPQVPIPARHAKWLNSHGPNWAASGKTDSLTLQHLSRLFHLPDVYSPADDGTIPRRETP
jgi:hypothetical protein